MFHRNGWLIALLVAAWAILCGGFYGSFFGQLEAGAPLDVSGTPTSVVLAIKGVLYAICIACLVLSVRSVAETRRTA